MNSIFITGATGFLGQHVTKRLLMNSSINVLIGHRSESNVWPFTNLNSPQLKLVNLDSTELVDRAFSEQKIDCILHMATEYGRHKSDIESILEANLILPLKVLNFGISNSVPHFINIDSYFNKEGKSYEYLFDYSQSKKSLLEWLKHHSDRIQVSNLVLEHIYGPGDGFAKFIPTLIRSAANNFNDGLKLSPGEQVRDFIYIEDVVEAIEVVVLAKLRSPYQFINYEIGSGIPTTLRELVGNLLHVLNKRIPAPFGFSPYRKDEIMYSLANLEAIESLGWHPKTLLRDGLLSTVQSILGSDEFQD